MESSELRIQEKHIDRIKYYSIVPASIVDQPWHLYYIAKYCRTTDLKLLLKILNHHNAGFIILPERLNLSLNGLDFIFYDKKSAEQCLLELTSIAISNKLIDNFDDIKYYENIHIFDIGYCLLDNSIINRDK